MTTDAEVVIQQQPEFTVPQISSLRRFARILAKKKLMAIGLFFLSIVAFAAIFADVVAPYHYSATDVDHILEGPSWTHPFGTDAVGSDTLSRIIYGARLALIVALGVSLIASTLGVTIALASVMLGGWFDLLLQRVVDAWQCFPNLVIILTAVAAFGPGLHTVILILGVNGAFGQTRVLRGSALREVSQQYVEAAQSMGASRLRIALRHVLPNIIPVMIVLGSLSFAFAILAEAGLSFLGYGVPPPHPSWGGMLSGQARQFMYVQPLLGVFPGVALSLTVWSVNLIGDGLRDVLDPRLRGTG
jgi:peptide/nickel transport system permease protein